MPKQLIKINRLSKSQERVLIALSGSPGLVRSQLVVVANVATGNLPQVLGSTDADKRAKNDKAYYPSLLSLKLIKVSMGEVAGRSCSAYRLSKEGKRVVGSLKACGDA